MPLDIGRWLPRLNGFTGYLLSWLNKHTILPILGRQVVHVTTMGPRQRKVKISYHLYKKQRGISYFFKIFIFSIIADLQCSVNFCYAAKGPSHMHTFFFLLLYKWSQTICYLFSLIYFLMNIIPGDSSKVWVSIVWSFLILSVYLCIIVCFTIDLLKDVCVVFRFLLL